MKKTETRNSMRIAFIAVVAVVLVWGCANQNSQTTAMASRTITKILPQLTPQEKAMQDCMINYISAAAELDSEAANSFLVTGLKENLIPLIKERQALGYKYYGYLTDMKTVIVDDATGAVTAEIIFTQTGMNGFMGIQQTYSLVFEKGIWKISAYGRK